MRGAASRDTSTTTQPPDAVLMASVRRVRERACRHAVNDCRIQTRTCPCAAAPREPARRWRHAACPGPAPDARRACREGDPAVGVGGQHRQRVEDARDGCEVDGCPDSLLPTCLTCSSIRSPASDSLPGPTQGRRDRISPLRYPSGRNPAWPYTTPAFWRASLGRLLAEIRPAWNPRSLHRQRPLVLPAMVARSTGVQLMVHTLYTHCRHRPPMRSPRA